MLHVTWCMRMSYALLDFSTTGRCQGTLRLTWHNLHVARFMSHVT